jgi:site-specific DNA-methyltransferase (adenine-specific)
MASPTSPRDDGASARRRTATSNFGAGRRESHDASAFYDRFPRPELSSDATVVAPRDIPEPFVCGDSRAMTSVADGEVALVVTSPPYFAGKQYEEELERDGIPSSYAEYLELLTDVFAECRRVLEPGGRIAVNVANLGRKPYRSLGSDVVDVLSRLGLLLRGEVVWRKGAGASGSCAASRIATP